jgi:hypothetical protein
MAGVYVNPEQYGVDELVLVQGHVCIIKEILQTALGFKKYQVQNLDTGEDILVSKHDMEKAVMESFDDSLEMNWNLDIEEIVNAPNETTENKQDETPKKQDDDAPRRHGNLTEEEIDAVAQGRLSAATEHQTKWAVNLFKGKK